MKEWDAEGVGAVLWGVICVGAIILGIVLSIIF